LGRKHTEASKKKMSASHQNRVISLKTRQKISNTQTGKKYGLETRLKHSGENSGMSKLNNEKVRFIRSKVRSNKDISQLADEYNVSHQTVKYAYLGKSWKHLDM
jgi:predicted transcriptional regulator